MSKTASNADWRTTVAQSYRSTEVRSIASVLASLEPGATSASKTMLAMRFEESIFKASSSLDDYKKSIQKRLKKLQKVYSKQQAAPGGGAEDASAKERERLLLNELRETFGSRLLYICEKADLAVQVLTEKTDDPNKANALQQHSQKVREWTEYMGLLGERKPLVKPQEDVMAHLTKLKAAMEKYVDVIRSHITKICDPDLFLEDTLLKLDEDFIKRASMSDLLQKAFQDQDTDCPQFGNEDMKRVMDKINTPLPIPRRNQEGGDIRAAVAKIEKIRVATQGLYTYMCLTLADKTCFSGALKKSYEVGQKCLKELEKEYDSLVKEMEDTDENGRRVIQLEDAWNNVLQFSDGENEPSASIDVIDAEEPEAKRQKLETVRRPIVICSRVLLAPGRIVISSILPVLKRKRAKLVQNKTASYVVLEFGNAFEMRIYFAPLIVTIRAMEKQSQDQLVTFDAGLRWPSIHQGLRPSVDNENAKLSVLGVTGSYSSLGHIITKKLEYASSAATLVLRRCFGETTIGKGALAKSDFEVEILEIGALVKFLQIARSTYIPDWVDDD